MSGVGGENCFHLLAPGVHIFGINVNLGGAAGNRPAHILIGNTGAAMQHQRNLHLLGNGFHLGKSQSGFTFIQTMGGAQRGGEAIHLGFCHQGVALLGIGVDDFGIDNAVFTAGDGPQFGLHRDTFAVGQRHQVAGNGQVFLNGRCEPSNIMELKPAAIAASQASREVP